MHMSGRHTAVDKVCKRFKQERETDVAILTHPTNKAVPFQGMHHRCGWACITIQQELKKKT